MALGYAQGAIAENDLETNGVPWKVMILDGARVASAMAVNNRTSANGNLYTQTQPLTAGIAFGALFEFADVQGLLGIIADIKTAMLAGDPFPVDLQDDILHVDADCVVDGGDWLKWPQQRTNEKTIKGVEMRFLTA
jgi:hypothetical protein